VLPGNLLIQSAKEETACRPAGSKLSRQQWVRATIRRTCEPAAQGQGGLRQRTAPGNRL